MALMSKTMPQMNVFFISMAVKVLLGLFLLSLSIGFSEGVIERVWESLFHLTLRPLG
jgi:flagellar biosynthesis protein FliR